MIDLEPQRQQSIAIKQGLLRSQDAAKVGVLESSLSEISAERGQTKAQKSYDDEMAEIRHHLLNKESRENSGQNGTLDEIEAMQYDPAFRRLADFIGLDPLNMGDYANELTVLMGWAKSKAKSTDILDALGQLKKTRTGLGFQEVGETALKKFYQFARLDMDSQRIQKEKELLKS